MASEVIMSECILQYGDRAVKKWEEQLSKVK